MARNVGPVQLPLAGLYGLLGVKDGSNPDVITGFVQPNVDALPFWLRAAREQLAGALTRAALGAGFEVDSLATVPQNEWWHIAQLEARAVLATATWGAGDSMEVSFVNASGQRYWSTGLLPESLMAEGGANTFAQHYVSGLWLPPGTRIVINWWAGAAGDSIQTGPLMGARARV